MCGLRGCINHPVLDVVQRLRYGTALCRDECHMFVLVHTNTEIAEAIHTHTHAQHS